ncbi:MAG: divergent polysaccharide deacetylase family protein [Gammaproteobacteria bacterium]|nr:divergent polysaccharide deacetylase family protein [Gammaproteobacteria bacterium]
MNRILLAALLSLLSNAALSGEAYLAIVIDDLGNRPIQDWRAIHLPGPVACAILPHTPAAIELARTANAQGKEVLLHQPMESDHSLPLGPGGLTTAMSRLQVQTRLRRNLNSLPHISGMNNHMGSLLTGNSEAMEWVMEELSARENLFFLDSRTSTTTLAYRTALTQGVPSTERDVFLDNDRNPKLIAIKLNQAAALARRNGTAIAIGHPYAATMSTLEQHLPRLLADGIRLVPVTSVIRYRLAGGNHRVELAVHQAPQGGRLTHTDD